MATLKYRQHGANQIGDNTGVAAKLTRLGKLLGGEYKAWNDDNLEALMAARSRLTPENQTLLNDFIELRMCKSHARRLSLFQRLGLYRQDTLGHWAMMLAALWGRI